MRAETQPFVRSGAGPARWPSGCRHRIRSSVATREATGNDHAVRPERGGAGLAAPVCCSSVIVRSGKLSTAWDRKSLCLPGGPRIGARGSR